MKAFLALATTLAGLGIAQAQSFVVTLDPSLEPATPPGRTGSGIGSLTLSGTTLSLNITFSGLSGTFTADHIHGPAQALPSSTAGVLYGLQSITTLTDGNHAGTISGTVNLIANPVPNYSIAQQLTDLNNGLWYVNVHSSTFGGGEIRGQILPVPEPSTLALAGLGAAGLLIWQRRRRN